MFARLPAFGRIRCLPVLAAALVLAALVVGPAIGRTAPVYRVPAWIPQNCSRDVTGAVLRVLASAPNGSIIQFRRGGCYRIDSTLVLKGRTGLTIDGNGSRFRSFGTGQLWQIVDSQRIRLRNLKLAGSYTRGGQFDPSVQGDHAVALYGSSAAVQDVSITGFGGDCVYFGLGTGDPARRSSGTVVDSSCSRTGRNGISIVAGDDITVKGVHFDAIGYNVFDVEPNPGDNFGSNSVRLDGNTIGAYAMNAYSIVESGPISNQSFTNNRAAGGGLRVAVADPLRDGFRPKNVTIRGNSSSTRQEPTPINVDNVDGLTITGNAIPLLGGPMVAVTGSCDVTIVHNSFPGGDAQSWFKPWVCSATPANGPVGSRVILGGSGFADARGVAVNGVPASFVVDSPARITLTVPSRATSGPIQVTSATGVAVSSGDFEVTAAGA